MATYTTSGTGGIKPKKRTTSVPGRKTGIKPSDFKKTGALHPMARIRDKRGVAAINGRYYEKGDTNLPYLIQKGTAVLKRHGFGKFDQTKNDQQSAIEFLFQIGCAVSQEPVDYSLADDNFDPSLDTEVIENENIVDIPAFQKITNKNILVTDKFSLAEDPFFRLDGDEYGGIPENILKSRKKMLTKEIKGVKEVAAAYAVVNTTDSMSSRLKAFKKGTHLV